MIDWLRAGFPLGCTATGLALAAAVCLGPTAVWAGGYDTGERDWDFLFQQDNIATEGVVRYIDPQRVLTITGGDFGPAGDVDEAEAFTIQRYSLAVRLADQARCLASYREPWGGHANYGSSWTYAASAVEQHFSSDDYGLTCAISAPLGMGDLYVLGGVSYQEIDYELTQLITVPDLDFNQFPTSTNVRDDGVGWRAGIAYEIPEYALRASLIYNSEIKYDMTGTVINPLIYTGPVYGSIAMPQSVELKLQSGVAPGWLAFGSLRWTDWSVADNMPLCPASVANCVQSADPSVQVSGLTLLWDDSWTATVGAAHKFSDLFSLVGSLTWDQGATQGFTSQTDTWVNGLTAILTPNKFAEIRLGGTVGVLTGGLSSTDVAIDGVDNPVGYTSTFGDDRVYSLSASAILRY